MRMADGCYSSGWWRRWCVWRLSLGCISDWRTISRPAICLNNDVVSMVLGPRPLMVQCLLILFDMKGEVLEVRIIYNRQTYCGLVENAISYLFGILNANFVALLEVHSKNMWFLFW